MIFDLLRVLLTPSCWIQNYEYSKEWDYDLNRLMANHKFTKVDGYTAKLGELEVWIAGHPFASFSPDGFNVRASRATILKAAKKLSLDIAVDRAPWREKMKLMTIQQSMENEMNDLKLKRTSVQINYTSSDRCHAEFRAKAGEGTKVLQTGEEVPPQHALIAGLEELARITALFGFGVEALEAFNGARARVVEWRAKRTT